MEWKQLLRLVNEITAVLTTEAELRQKDVAQFLLSTVEEFVPIYISHKHLFLYSIAVPQDELPEDLAELRDYSVDVCSSFSYWQSGSERPTPDNFSLSPPGETNEPECLGKGTPLTTLKYYRYNESGKYIQLPQDLIDIAQLHWDEEMGDFCRINGNGDREVVCHISIDESSIVVAIKAQVLYAYLLLKKSVLVRVFDVTRIKDDNLLPFNDSQREDVSQPKYGIYAHSIGNRAKPADMTLMRGAQIVGADRQYVWSQAKPELLYELEDQRYCDFIIKDWKNEKVSTCSCAPEEMSSYFESSNDKPFETSPAFFRPEVLDKYKNNPDLYELKDRRIYKIDGWGLKTYE